MYVIFQLTEVKLIVLNKRLFLFLFNYSAASYYTVFLYSNCTIIDKNMHTGEVNILSHAITQNGQK